MKKNCVNFIFGQFKFRESALFQLLNEMTLSQVIEEIFVPILFRKYNPVKQRFSTWGTRAPGGMPKTPRLRQKHFI